MSMITAEDRAAMRESFHRLLNEASDEQAVRNVIQSETAFDSALWKQLAELGLLGILIDPDHGGLGGGALEINDLMEEVGAHLMCGPFLTSAVLSSVLLNTSTDEEKKSSLLPALASGELIATAALTGETGNWTPEDVSVFANGNTLNGSAHYVMHCGIANVILVAAQSGNGLKLFTVSPDAEGLTKTPMNPYDLTLSFSTLTFTDVAADPVEGVEKQGFVNAIELARIALAGEQAGGSKHVFDMTLNYIKDRYQFGRAIGGFQAVKHMAADLYIEVESALTASRQAAAALASDAPDKDILVNLAAWTCADTFTRTTHDAIQLHGGIAFTWDHPAHLYFRRARADAFLLGAPDYFRELYLQAQEATR